MTSASGPLAGRTVGYVPYDASLTAPADRRRFAHYARQRGIPFELAHIDRRYDVVVLTQRADITGWARRADDGTKIVFDFIDSYLAVARTSPRACLRGLAKFVTRQYEHLELDHHAALEKMCARADAVICSTEEQRAHILRFCPNVRPILDIQACDVLRVKSTYDAGPVFNFVWEGLGPRSTIAFCLLRDILEPLVDSRDFALHLLTDLKYGHFHGRYYQRYAVNDVQRIFGRWARRVYAYQWNQQMFATICAACDMALIPMPMDSAFDLAKPENKLLLFWRLGVPALTSATPAYKRAMHAAGIPMACASPQEWQSALRAYMDDPNARRAAAIAGRAYAEREHGEVAVLDRWDRLFESVLER